MTEGEAFVRTIVDNPGDDTPRLVYADWLDDRGDLRGPYLRAEREWARPWREGRRPEPEPGLAALAGGLDPVWVARVSRPPAGVCCDHVRFREPAAARSRPLLTPANVDWVETRFGITFPADYRAFLLNENGGAAEPGHFRLPGRDYPPGRYEQVTNFGTVWAVAEPETDWDYDLVWNQISLAETRAADERWRGDPHRHLAVIGLAPTNGELEVVCLGVGGPVAGRVFCVSPVVWGDDVSDYVEVAPTFAAFLGMMADHDVDHIRAIKSGSLADLRRWLSGGGDSDEMYHGSPLLLHAIHHDQLGSVRELIEHRATVHEEYVARARYLRHPAIADVLAGHLAQGASVSESPRPEGM